MTADALALLDRTRVVDVETRSASGTVHRVPIWVLVIEGKVYVASVKGKRGRWWRELTRTGEGALIAGRTRVPVRAHPVRAETARAAAAAAYARKYRTSRASVALMRKPDALETLLRLEPLPG